jgi:hypothetical protein
MPTSSASAPAKSVTLPQCQIHLRDDGIIEYNYTTHGELDLDFAQRLIASIRTMNDRRRPVLGRLNKVTGVTRSARIFFDGCQDELVSMYSIMAVITDSPLSRIIVNFFTSFSKLPIPIKCFTDEEKAVEWLLHAS